MGSMGSDVFDSLLPPPGGPWQATRTAIERLLDHDLLDRRGHQVAVVRGFDIASREFRGVVRDLATARGLSVIEVATTPPLGSLPRADGVRVVFAARRSLASLAQRCAAHWGAPVLTDATAAAREVSFTSTPALAVTAPDGLSDAVAARLVVQESLTYRVGTSLDGHADGLELEPAGDGVLLHAVNPQHEAGVPRTSTGPVRVELRRASRAVLDGHPMLLPAGVYHVEYRRAAFHRVTAAPSEGTVR